MIISINNSDEKALIVKYLNKINGTKHPTTFFVNVGGYIAIDGNDFIHFTTFERAAEYAKDNKKIFISFVEFVENLINSNVILQKRCDEYWEAFEQAKEEISELKARTNLNTSLFNKIFKL